MCPIFMKMWEWEFERKKMWEVGFWGVKNVGSGNLGVKKFGNWDFGGKKMWDVGILKINVGVGI